MNIDEFKRNLTGEPKYALKNANVWVHPEGKFHVIDYLDPSDAIDSAIDHAKLTSSRIEEYKQHAVLNRENFDMHVDLISRHGGVEGKSVLDIGCGPGDSWSA